MRALLGRQRLLVYLILIAGPALVLLGLSIHSVFRQMQALDALRRANARLEAERLERAIDDKLREVAATAVRDEAFGQLEAAIDRPWGPDATAAAAAAEEIVARHPVGRHAFVVDHGGVVWPPARTALPAYMASLPSAGGPPLQRYLHAFADAEALELRLGQPARAAAAYERLLNMDLPPVLQAQALSRAARSYARAGHAAGAINAWHTLALRYPDVADSYGQPHGLLAAVALAESGPAGANTTATVEGTYRALTEGRWPLSADEVEYFLGALERLMGRDPASRPRTGFLSSLDLARALEEQFSPRSALAAGETQAVSVGRDGRFVVHYTNGRSQGRLVGISVDTRWVHRDLRQSVMRQLSALGGAGPSPPFSRAAWRIPGEPQVMVFAATTMLVIAALAVGVVLLLRDVGREAQLNHLRARFVSGVSHDLKTPLTVVKLYAESLADDEEPSSEERRHFYQIILRESERLTRMIDRVLAFARSDGTTSRYSFVTGSIVPVVAAALDQFGPYLRHRGFESRVQMDQLLPDVRLDAVAVKEAIVNLLDNAVKYSAHSRVLDVRVFKRDPHVVVAVQDYGSGIPPDEHARIFQPFYRGNADTGQGGHGLGLALVSEVMKAHGGAVELDSAIGVGSCFRLVFPAC